MRIDLTELDDNCSKNVTTPPGVEAKAEFLRILKVSRFSIFGRIFCSLSDMNDQRNCVYQRKGAEQDFIPWRKHEIPRLEDQDLKALDKTM